MKVDMPLNCWICKVVHTNTQLRSKQSYQTRRPLEEEDYLSSIWLCTYRHIIAWTLWWQVLLLFYISFPLPLCMGSGLWGGISCFKPARFEGTYPSPKNQTCYGPIYYLDRSVLKLLVLDRNTWNHITVRQVRTIE